MTWTRRGLRTLPVLALLACPHPADDESPAGDAAVANADAGWPAPDAGGNGGEALSTREADWLTPLFPSVTRKLTHAIPASFLDEEDVTNENNVIWELLDDKGTRLGFARDILTHVNCVSGICRAIRFILVFQPDVTFLHVFHPSGTENDFMKYWQGEHLAYSEADRAKLDEILINPPAALVQVADTADLVVGSTTTAPTEQVYQPLVVRGSVFTCWKVLQAMLTTRDIIHEQVAP